MDTFLVAGFVVRCTQQSRGKVGYKMAKFTQEQMEQLRQSPHVLQVTESSVMLKVEFKLYLWEQKQQGRSVREVLRENGIDPKVFGEKRLENLSYRLNRDIRDTADFAKSNGRTAAPAEGEMDLEARVRWLTHQLEYTRQEVEFLKKLQMANTEARKEWESKHRPK